MSTSPSFRPATQSDAKAVLQVYSNPKSFVNFLLPPLNKGRVGVGEKTLRLLQGLLYWAVFVARNPGKQLDMEHKKMLDYVFVQ